MFQIQQNVYFFPMIFSKGGPGFESEKDALQNPWISDKSPPYFIPSLTLFIQVNGANWSSHWIRFEDYEESAAGQSLGPFYSKHDVWSASGSATSATLIFKGYILSWSGGAPSIWNTLDDNKQPTPPSRVVGAPLSMGQIWWSAQASFALAGVGAWLFCFGGVGVARGHVCAYNPYWVLGCGT